jgi:sigma-B regulation protein RsbU (phosphoserine phosphatase)
VTGVGAAPAFDAQRVRAILAPFATGAARLSVRLEDSGGDVVATSGDDGRSATPSLSRELRVAGVLVGRVVATGADVGEPLVRAAIEALAVSLEQLADAERRAALTDREAARASTAIAAELALGRVQQRTIVSLIAPDVGGYDLASHYEPAREIGGDFFELFRLRRRGHPLGIVIADVAGKGIGAALLMAFARPVIHTALTAASGPADALERVNRILVGELHTTLFITALAGRLDVRTGLLRLANAGHEPPLLVPGDGGTIRPVEGGGPLLGAFPGLGVGDVEVQLEPGDQLVLYTDGVTDARSAAGERFGKTRLLEALEGSRGATAHDLVAAVRDGVEAFCGTTDPVDDVTIVAVGRQGAP